MATIPISQFEHRVARWVIEIEKTREPLEISQRGRARIVVLDKETYDRLREDRDRLEALQIKLLVDAGLSAIAKGRSVSHQEVGRLLRKPARPLRRKA